MEFIFNTYSIQNYSVSNGDECTHLLPCYCDSAQQYLVSGFGWRPSPTTMAMEPDFAPGVPNPLIPADRPRTRSAPVLLPPWTQYIQIMVRGFHAEGDESDVAIDLRNSDNTETISIADVTIDALPSAGTDGLPDDIEAVLIYPWSSGGSIGQGTPDGDSTMLQVTPSNAYVPGFIRLIAPSAWLALYEISYLCIASQSRMS